MELVEERSREAGWGNSSLHQASCGACGSWASLEEGQVQGHRSLFPQAWPSAVGCVGPERTRMRGSGGLGGATFQAGEGAAGGHAEIAPSGRVG